MKAPAIDEELSRACGAAMIFQKYHHIRNTFNTCSVNLTKSMGNCCFEAFSQGQKSAISSAESVKKCAGQ